MNHHLKQAYTLGAQQALADAGIKVSREGRWITPTELASTRGEYGRKSLTEAESRVTPHTAEDVTPSFITDPPALAKGFTVKEKEQLRAEKNPNARFIEDKKAEVREYSEEETAERFGEESSLLHPPVEEPKAKAKPKGVSRIDAQLKRALGKG